MKFILLLLSLMFTSQVLAYSNFIGHGYTSCLNCHYNPSGGGPLNDYGRVVGATLISGRGLYPSSWSEEKIADSAGFLFRKPKQDFLRTQINYRGFQLVRNPGSSESETKQWINMQFDGRAILKFGKNDRFIMVGNYGYAPRPQGADEDISEWRSREHYLGFRITPKLGIYTGLMDKVFGIKVIEHIAYSRTLPQVAQNDQVHGVMAHYLGDMWEMMGQGFVGNLSQDDDLRMKGASLWAERTIFDTHRVGTSFMKSSNQYLDMLSYAAFTRLNLKDGAALLGEFGQTVKTPKTSDATTSRYFLLQTYLRPTRGLYFLGNIEYNQLDLKQEDYTMRWGPGVQWFPMQRFEIRLDVYNSRTFAPQTTTEDSWMYLLQTHIWL